MDTAHDEAMKRAEDEYLQEVVKDLTLSQELMGNDKGKAMTYSGAVHLPNQYIAYYEITVHVEESTIVIGSSVLVEDYEGTNVASYDWEHRLPSSTIGKPKHLLTIGDHAAAGAGARGYIEHIP